MKCIKCEKEIQEDFKVCPYCGAKIVHNPVICPNCDNVVSGDYEICSECGSRLDGKKVCSHCGALVEEDYKFCPTCAKSLIEVKQEKKESKPKAPKEVIATKIKDIKDFVKSPTYLIKVIGKTLITMFALLIFVFSMCKTTKFEVESLMLDIETKVNIEAETSVWDTLGAAFNKKNYDFKAFKDEYYADYFEFVERSGEAESDYEYIEVYEDFLEDVNPYKFAQAQFAEYDTIDMKPILIVRAIVGIATVIASAGFLVYSSLDLYKTITKKNKDKNALPVFEFLLIGLFILNSAFNMKLKTAFTRNGGLSIAVLVLACVCIVLKYGFNQYEKYQERKFDLVKTGISLVKITLASIAIGLSFLATTTVTYSYVDEIEPSQLTYDYNMVDYISYEFLAQDEKYTDKEKYTSSIYDEAIAETVLTCNSEDFVGCEDSEGVKLTLNPHSIGNQVKPSFLQGKINTNLFVVASYINLLAALFLVVYIYLEIIESKKGNKLSTLLVATGLTIAGFALNIVANNNYFDIIKNLKLVSIREVSVVSAGSIVRLVFVALFMATEIGEAIISNSNKEKQSDVDL